MDFVYRLGNESNKPCQGENNMIDQNEVVGGS